MTFQEFYNFELAHFCAKAYRFYCNKEQQQRIADDKEFRHSYYATCKKVFDRVYLPAVRLDFAAQTHKIANNIDVSEVGSLMNELNQYAGVH